MNHLLSWIIWLPVLGGMGLMALPEGRAKAARAAALALALAEMALCLLLLARFDGSLAGAQFSEYLPWVPAWGLGYRLGVDGISVFLVALNGLLGLAALLAAWKRPDHWRAMAMLILAAEGAAQGAFLARDVVLFYLFFEASLIPIYLLIGVWGGEKRVAATTRFLLYTLFGSLLMLAAILVMYFQVRTLTGKTSFDMADWQGLTLPLGYQAWLFGAFFLAFAIKAGLFPLHSWLPEAYRQAPVAGVILLAGSLAKMGSYGMLRFCLPFFPLAAHAAQPLVAGLALASLLYGAGMALVQPDFKGLLSYASVSHMGLCVLGLFSLDLAGWQGGLLTMVNHGVSIAALFFVAGLLWERLGTDELSRHGGAYARMPALGLLLLPAAFSFMGVPGTNGFVNEFLSLWGAFQYRVLAGALGALGLILGAAYMLGLVKKVMLGPSGEAMRGPVPDLDGRERLVLGALVLVIFVAGIFPNLLLSRMGPSLSQSLQSLTAPVAVAMK